MHVLIHILDMNILVNLYVFQKHTPVCITFLFHSLLVFCFEKNGLLMNITCWEKTVFFYRFFSSILKRRRFKYMNTLFVQYIYCSSFPFCFIDGKASIDFTKWLMYSPFLLIQIYFSVFLSLTELLELIKLYFIDYRC